jgi:hypothetical protein
MSKATYPLKLPASIKAAAARLAKEDGVSLNQGNASPEDLRAFLANAPDIPPEPGDEIPDHLRATPRRVSARE